MKTNTVKNEEDFRAERQAKSKIEGIIDMVKRLEHSQECKGNDECGLTSEDIFNGLNLYYSASDKINGTQATQEQIEEYHNEENARQSIDESPLSIQIRSGWYNPGEKPEAEEYEILLCTGGPAVRIIGDLDQYKQPESATIQYQDWFTPWVEYRMTKEEEETVVKYAQCFYFGE